MTSLETFLLAAAGGAAALIATGILLDDEPEDDEEETTADEDAVNELKWQLHSQVKEAIANCQTDSERQALCAQLQQVISDLQQTYGVGAQAVASTDEQEMST